MKEPTNVKRRLARVVSVLAVAVLLGHVVQTMSETPASPVASAPVANPNPKAVVPVAAGPTAAVLPAMSAPKATATTQSARGMAASAKPAPVAPALPMQPTAAMPVRLAILPDVMASLPATLPPKTAQTAPVIVSATDPEPSIVPKSMEALLRPDDACKEEMDLAVLPDAIIEVTLLAPCHVNERLVLRHGPLAISARTTANGSVFLKIPALDADGDVSLRFADGTEIKGAVAVSEMADLKRFAVQWLDQDTFEVNAFENGATYGQPGHVSAANPGNLPLTGQTGGGFLMILGDAEAVPAMLAEVYSYPRDTIASVEVSIEATVTAATCNRELLGEVITSEAGAATVSDLVLAMPDCTALGDILVLKNPVSDLTLAAAN